MCTWGGAWDAVGRTPREEAGSGEHEGREQSWGKAESPLGFSLLGTRQTQDPTGLVGGLLLGVVYMILCQVWRGLARNQQDRVCGVIKGNREKCISVQFSPVPQSCRTLCDPMDCGTPGFPVHHQLSEPTQTHVHRVGDAVQPTHPLLSPSPPAFNLSQHQHLFQ